MKTLIESMAQQLQEAIEIGKSKSFSCDKTFDQVVILGQGGSGIGGTIISEISYEHLSVPVIVNKNYSIPAFVSDRTLVIVSTYSGNTEETLTAMKACAEKGAEMAVITSGGEALQTSQEKGWSHYVVPGGNPPRSMLAYSLTLQLYILKQYNLLNFDFESELTSFIEWLGEKQDQVIKEGKWMAQNLYGKNVLIYACTGYEGVAIRFRQQLNENSKMLANHAIVPEMNHNELVGWSSGNDSMAACFLRNEIDRDRNQRRIEINKEIIQAHTPHIFEIWSKHKTRLSTSLHLIHLTDWVSFFLSELNGVDIIAIDAIDRLKNELAKF